MDDLTRRIAAMSEDEMRARSEAAIMGHLNVIDTTLAALIMQAPKPSLIRNMLSELLDNLKHAQPESRELAWVPGAIHDGAAPAAEYLLKACAAAEDPLH